MYGLPLEKRMLEKQTLLTTPPFRRALVSPVHPRRVLVAAKGEGGSRIWCGGEKPHAATLPDTLV